MSFNMEAGGLSRRKLTCQSWPRTEPVSKRIDVINIHVFQMRLSFVMMVDLNCDIFSTGDGT